MGNVMSDIAISVCLQLFSMALNESQITSELLNQKICQSVRSQLGPPEM